MAELSPYELNRRGKHILAELDGYTIDEKIELLLYLLELLINQKQRGEK